MHSQKGYEQTDFVETDSPVRKLTTSKYLVSLVGKCGWNMDHLHVDTTVLNSKIDDDDIYQTLLEWWPGGLNACEIMVRVRKGLSSIERTPSQRLVFETIQQSEFGCGSGKGPNPDHCNGVACGTHSSTVNISHSDEVSECSLYHNISCKWNMQFEALMDLLLCDSWSDQ